MSTNAVLPVPLQQFFDEDGHPLANGKLYSYEAGTAYSILQSLYTDADLTVAFANPVTLTVYGRTPGPVYPLAAPAYDILVTDAHGVTVWTG